MEMEFRVVRDMGEITTRAFFLDQGIVYTTLNCKFCYQERTTAGTHGANQLCFLSLNCHIITSRIFYHCSFPATYANLIPCAIPSLSPLFRNL